MKRANESYYQRGRVKCSPDLQSLSRNENDIRNQDQNWTLLNIFNVKMYIPLHVNILVQWLSADSFQSRLRLIMFFEHDNKNGYLWDLYNPLFYTEIRNNSITH